jgi:flagellar export protein FliJ
VKKSRLHAVLRLRSLAERQARGKLAESERELARAREILEHRRQAPLPQVPAEVLSPLQLRVLSMQGVRSHELLVQAAAEAERNRTARDDAQRHWSDATRELKSTERLDERRRTQLADAARAAAERALDEMVVLRRGYAR